MAGGAPPTTAAGAPLPSSSNPTSSSGLPPPPPPPKILLSKPSPAASVDSSSPASSSSAAAVVLRSRSSASQPGSLNLLHHDSWDLHIDRALPFLTENTDFTVIGVIGPPGVGKSTVLNELYGYDGSSPGMLPPFPTQSDETRAMARHCSMGIELRVSAERLILLDTQPIFSPSVLVDMMRPDGSSTIPVLSGESLSADLAHELMGIQLGVFLASVCNVLLVVSEGIHDLNMWQLMLTVDLLKHGIPDPSLLFQGSNSGLDKENKLNMQSASEDFLPTLVFVHTKLQDQDLSPSSIMLLRQALLQFFSSSSFEVNKCGDTTKAQMDSSVSLSMKTDESESMEPDMFFVPLKGQDDLQRPQFGSYLFMLGKLRDRILSMNPPPFGRTVSEREWLKNSAKIWDLVKKSPVVADYCRTLQNSGLFRK